MNAILPRTKLISDLRKTLNHLNDPFELRHSPLISVFPGKAGANSHAALKKSIYDAIDALMPNERTPQDATAWKTFELLNYRFIDHLSQKSTAKALLISLRTLQRIEREAIWILADRLVAQWALQVDDEPSTSQFIDNNPGDFLDDEAQIPQELDILKTSYPTNMVDLNQVLDDISEIANQLTNASQREITIQRSPSPLLVNTHPIILRQAILAALSALASQERTSDINLSICELTDRAEIIFRLDPPPSESFQTTPGNEKEFIPSLKSLITICNGTVEYTTTEIQSNRLVISLPLNRQFRILVVDDNADAVRLIQRYLDGSDYTVVGSQKSVEVLSWIIHENPDLIILDVMLPEIDGWLLLGQIRRTNAIAKIPVVISTILLQQALVTPLGANAFLHKPFTRQELLQTLDQILVPEQE